MHAYITALTTVFVGMVVAIGMWQAKDAELDEVMRQQTKMAADVRHWKGIAYRAQDYENQAIHDAQAETMAVYQRMQGEVDACRAGKR